MKIFTDHPTSIGETYSEHLVNAQKFGWQMTLAGLACVIHSVFPFLFANTARKTTGQLYMKLIGHRDSIANINADESMSDAEPATFLHI